jgi:serine protease AprX
MKITFLSVLALFTLANMSAQSTEDRAKIKSVQNNENIRLLKDKLLTKEIDRKQKISAFIAQNPGTKSEFLSNGRFYKISDIINNQPVYKATDNSSEAAAIRTNRLYQGGSLGLSLDGLNMDAGIWDGGWILPTHVEFVTNGVSRVSILDGEGGENGIQSHATHVGGTVGATGVSSSAKGMAPKSNLLSYQWDNDENEVLGEVAQGLLVSNHSYGIPIYRDDNVTHNAQPWYMGAYSGAAAEWDDIAFNFEYYLMVKSAGNEGTVSYTGGLLPGHDKLTGEANSKNNLVIANANVATHVITGNITSLAMNTSSSQGPSDDGRIKPDITADGTNVFSSYNGSNTDYASISGTSMAAPCVTGSILLLQQHYNNLHSSYMRSATLKGLICHTALDDNDVPGPDPRWGWGLMNTEAAANVITNANTNQNLLLESTLQAGTTFTYNFTVNGAGVVKTTLCWTDPAGNPVFEVINSPAAALVNDLDIRVTRNGLTYFPWKLDLANLFDGAITGDNTVDNVERIDMTNLEPGQYTITVSHKGTLTNGSQKFSLILSGANITLNTEKNEFSNVVVWPNPAKDVLNVNFGQQLENVSATLVDMSGRVVFQTKGAVASAQNLSINTSNLSKGVYVLSINSNNKSLSKKVIIE